MFFKHGVLISTWEPMHYYRMWTLAIPPGSCPPRRAFEEISGELVRKTRRRESSLFEEWQVSGRLKLRKMILRAEAFRATDDASGFDYCASYKMFFYAKHEQFRSVLRVVFKLYLSVPGSSDCQQNRGSGLIRVNISARFLLWPFSTNAVPSLVMLASLRWKPRQEEVQDGLDGGELSTQMRGKVSHER